eukprot:4847954-Amphidinium_carterae.2
MSDSRGLCDDHTTVTKAPTNRSFDSLQVRLKFHFCRYVQSVVLVCRTVSCYVGWLAVYCVLSLSTVIAPWLCFSLVKHVL